MPTLNEISDNKKIATEWHEGKTIAEGAATVKKPAHLCYICGNEGFIPVGQGLYRCYREVCVYRDNKGLISGELKKKVCYVCGKVGETHNEIGEYKGLPLFRCSNNSVCQLKLIRGIGMVYTDTGVYKYDRKVPKEQPPVLLTDEELKELRTQELKEKMEQLKQADHKPTILELVVISLQEGYYTTQELSTKLGALLSTVKAIVPYGIRRMGYNLSIITGENKVLKYKIEDPKAGVQESDEDATEKVKEGILKTDNPLLEELFGKPKAKKLYVLTVPKSGGIFNMFELLKTGEYTISELAVKTGLAETTVQMHLGYHMKNKTMSIVFDKKKYKIGEPPAGPTKDVSGQLPSPDDGSKRELGGSLPVARLTPVQQRAYDKLIDEWKPAKELGEYPDVLNKLVGLGLAKIDRGFLYMRK